jgi:TonB family protein
VRLAFFVFVPLASAFAQPFPDAAKLLAQGAETLARHHSYEYTTEMTMDMGAAMPFPIVSSTLTQAVNPGKLRMESKAAGLSVSLAISDGEHFWTYIPFLKQYTKADGSEGMQSLVDEMAGIPDSSKLTSSAKVIRSEAREMDGQPHDCWVVESRVDKLPGQPGAAMQDVVSTQWIDKTLGLALETTTSGKTQDGTGAAMQIKMKTTLHSLKFDEDLPDSLFVFTPPAGAKETKELIPGMPAAPTTPNVSSIPPQKGEPQAFVPMLNPIERSEPDYPAAARSQGIQGMVNLLVTIDPDGQVVKVEPLTGREILRPAAVDTVKQWKYRPVLRDGHPVYAYTGAMVDFIIDPKKPPKNLEDMGFDMAEQMAEGERIAELQKKFPRSPEQVVADLEQQNSGGDEMERFSALPDLAKKSVDAGALDKAASYANEMLRMASQHRGDWNYGNAIHDGNMVLGLVALRQGSVANAKQYLLESAKSSGSPQLDSFGPDLTLARELLQKGERDAVLEYISLCRTFWKMGGPKLDAMSDAVRTGGTF